MRSLLLIAHGSRRAPSNREVEALARSVRHHPRCTFDDVRCAFLELGEPTIEAAIAACAEAGATEVVALPWFLAAGRHVTDDVPALLDAARAAHPGVRIVLTDHFGADPALPAALLRFARAHTAEGAPAPPAADPWVGALLAGSGEALVLTDDAGRVRSLNRIASDLCGWPEAEARGTDAAEVLMLVDEATRERLPDPVARTLRSAAPLSLDPSTLLLRRHTRQEFAVEGTAAPVRNAAQRVVGVALALRDVTELRGLTRVAVFQSTHDTLTGLINRREFERRLRRALDAHRDDDTPRALVYLQLDQYATVCEAGDYFAGEALVRQAAEQLRSRVRESDVLARLEGDRFALLLEGCGIDMAERIAEGLREAIRRVRFAWDAQVWEISASIGVAVLDAASGSVADVLNASRSAADAARERGRNRIHVYQSGDARRYGHAHHSRWLRQVQQAIELGRFRLLVQAIEPLGAGPGRGRHGELLLRMLGDDGELVTPDSFLAAAERYELMPAIDRWVVDAAFALLEQERGPLSTFGVCAINLSGQSFADPESLRLILRRLDESTIAPAKVCFEITETAAIADLDAACEYIRTVKDRGCRFALDDFGSGVSSFGYLRRLPVDYLKIDGSFVQRMAEDGTDRAMVESINRMAHVLGMQTVAEYVPDARTLELLRRIGVDFAQGSAVQEPQPLGEV